MNMKTLRGYIAGFLFAILGTSSLFSQELPAGVEEQLLGYGPSNMGRDFWLAFPANWDLPGSTSYYIRLYISSPVRTEVKVWAGAGLKKIVYTVPNKIVRVDLLPSEAQMFVRADQPPVPDDRIFKKKAVHVRAGAPVVVYGMNRTTFTSDGLLAYPVNALGREYVIASYGAVIGVSQELPSQYMIIAPYNGTRVEIYHPHRTPNHKAGETFTIDLDSGDVWSAMTVGYNGDMTGAVIRANKPVAVTAGQACTYIPNLLNFCCCDHLTEMMLPTSSWGKIYHGTPFQTRLKGDFYRVFAKEPNTKVFINGDEYATLATVGGEEGIGWFEYRALGRFSVEFSADKPIYVSQYNTSQAYDGVPSDPFFLVLTPVEQYQKRLYFCTPDADFPQNFLNIVCQEDEYDDIEITKADENNWRPVASLPDLTVPQRYPTLIGGKRYITVTAELDPGTYQMRGKTAFAGYLYGFSNYDSYGYPMSVFAADKTVEDRESPVISKTQSCDGSVGATVQDLPRDSARRSNLATVELDWRQGLTENYDLSIKPFESGVQAETGYSLTVLDKSKPARAVVIVSDKSGNVSIDTVVYQPLNISLQDTPLNFGKMRAGSEIVRKLIVTNNSDNPATIKEVLLKSRNQNFELLSPKGEFVIPAHQSVDVEVKFTADLKGRPNGRAVFEDSVGFRDECGLRYMALVNGQVVKPVIEVTDHDFGGLPADMESRPWSMDVRNVSQIDGSTLTVFARTGPANNSGQTFSIKGGDAIPIFTLEPGQSRTLQITARPANAMEYNDTIFFQSDAMEGDSSGWLRVRGGVASVGTPGGIAAVSSLELVPNLTDRGETTLRYQLRKPAILVVTLIDAAGKEVRVIESGRAEEAGTHSLTLDLKGLAAGTYAVRVESNGETDVRRLVIVR